MKTLNIKPVSDIAESYYKNHTHFHKGDSGLDLYLLEDFEISLGETKFIDLGIQCQMVEKKENLSYVNFNDVSYYLYPRSSFSKYPLIMGNHVGIIDSSYRGNILACVKYLPHENELKTLISNLERVILNNKYHSEVAYVDKSYESMIDDIPKLKIEAGTRLFQICSGDLEPFDFKLVDELPSTSRGSGGFGSTNK